MTKRIFVAIALCLFLASFTQPAFYIDMPEKDAWSDPFGLFFLGWMGLFAGSITFIIWLANPFFIIAVILFLRNKKKAFLFSLLAALCAAGFLLMHTIIVSEQPAYARITVYKAGYWLWLSGMAVLLLGSFIHWLRPSSTGKPPY